MEPTAQFAATPIPAPADFPIQWSNPSDAQYHWTRDREHLPDPLTPLMQSISDYTAITGFQRGGYAYDEAIQRRHYQLINHYSYNRIQPFQGSTEELEARKRSNRAKLSAVAARLEQAWKEEWLPVLEKHWRFWADFDLQRASLQELVAHFEQSLEGHIDLYRIHYLMGPPMWFAIDEFVTFYCDLFPGKSELDAHRLLQGFDNKTLQAGHALWRLSRRAKETPLVARLLADLPTPQVLPALHHEPAASVFLEEFAQYLQAYGGRSDLWDWGYPSWQDDPTPVINNLKNYLNQPERDLEDERAQAAADREAAIAAARAGLQGYPLPVVERFEQLLSSAQVALVLTEDHTYYIDFNGFGWMHRILQEFGKRSAAQGQLFAADDIFYLKLAEFRRMIAQPEVDMGATARERRADLEKWRQYDEPLELGTRPAQPLSLYSADARRIARYSGSHVADKEQPAQSSHLLRGQAGSAGVARGRARVLNALSEADQLQPGEILVTPTTAPPWTPLFLTAAALVTDAGGLLSHGAVVAREYRIPAVVGTGCASRMIRSGQWIEVDGSQGSVTILDEAL